MWSRLTIIGVVIGSVIMGIGAASLVSHLGLITVDEDYAVPTGQSVSYLIPAPAGTEQLMSITGERFNVTMSSPGDGLQVPNTEYRESARLVWTHAESGDTTIHIRNTGAGDVLVEPLIVRSSDPVWIAFDFMVVISGIIIIGLSLGFAARKPKGF